MPTDIAKSQLTFYKTFLGREIRKRLFFLWVVSFFYCDFVSGLLVLEWIFIRGSFQTKVFIQDSESDVLGLFSDICWVCYNFLLVVISLFHYSVYWNLQKDMQLDGFEGWATFEFGSLIWKEESVGLISDVIFCYSWCRLARRRPAYLGSTLVFITVIFLDKVRAESNIPNKLIQKF